MSAPGIYISAARKSSGKTTIAIGICAALKQRGMRVRAFKKGPDYIDPMWLARAGGFDCINLDFHTMRAGDIRASYSAHARGADIAVIEGNKGLHDGVDVDGADSNAALAKLLRMPVLLVLDAGGITRGIAPLALGQQLFDREIKIAGVILNRVGGARHETKLRAALERHTDIKVLGALHRDRALEISERHLGLITATETDDSAIIGNITAAVNAQVDIDKIISLAGDVSTSPSPAVTPSPVVSASLPVTPSSSVSSSPLVSPSPPASPSPPITPSPSTPPPPDITIGIARDSAFGFYYADDLHAFAQCGARLLPFDALRDTVLPEVDGIYIGGGFPETHAAELSANRAMRDALKKFVARDGPVYAECGGLMYLAQQLIWDGRRHEMAGALPAQVEMRARPVGRGYVTLRETAHGLWPRINGAARDIPAHEFHHSKISGVAPDAKFAYQVKRGHGIDGSHDGLIHRNLLASYSHLRNTAENPWVARFVNFVRAHKQRRK